MKSQILIASMLAMLAASPCLPAAADGDARLNDVFFVDSQRGWAVGDRGTILHTDDAGQHWRPQESGVDCSLRSVSFVNEQLGWAAGGLTRPYTHLSAGVLLNTRDGGKTWTRDPNLFLPALRKVGFSDNRRGWAVACRSSIFSGGVFTTEDGGRNWRPLAGDAAAGWLGGHFLGPRIGLLAGPNGSAALVRGGQIESLRGDGFELRSFTDARLLSPTDGWLVGEGGLVRRLTDQPPPASATESSALVGGATLVPPGTLGGYFAKVIRHFDFVALAVRGPDCWIAGDPGTLVFHSADAGRTWQGFATGSAIPLRAITFADPQHGWAVGELGVILATSDGGRTWRRQDGGGSRAALLCVAAEPDDVPLELIARVSGSEGYRTAVLALGRRDVEIAPRDDVPLADRLHEAVVGVGGSAAKLAWQFPLRQPGLRAGQQQILDAWDRLGEGHGLDQLRARVVQAIRTWRPAVVVVGNALDEDDNPLSLLVRQAVTQAVSDAANPKAFPNQIADAGLTPWRTARLFAAAPPEGRGAIEVVTSQFSPALGRSLEDAAAEPRGLLRDQYSSSPRTIRFRPPGGGAAEGGQRDFFTGLAIPLASESRRALPPPPLERLDAMQRAARRRRQAEAIIAMAARNGGAAEQLLAQIDTLTADLDPEGAGQLFYHLADHYSRSGRWPLAAEVFEAMVERYPQHPLCPLAFQWLMRYYSSTEVSRRLGQDASQQAKWRTRALALGQQIERRHFEWFGQPGVRFPLATAYRALGQTRQAEKLYQAVGRNGGRDAWWACAQAELPSNDAKGRPVKSRLVCVRATERPHLDGRLDDPVWRKAKSAALRSAQGDDERWPATVMLAYDDEFLYLAMDCRKNVPGAPPSPPADAQASTEPAADPATAERRDNGKASDEDARPTPPTLRPRDADLAAQDRVEMFLDIDRDYATYYYLAVDHRGWTFDRCWDDATWDPAWFVASQ
ncbi:MAG: YCF48-related protein, partial [Thermoguttaceae bacterium]